MTIRTRRRLIAVMSGTMAGGMPPGQLPVTDGLGAWYKADGGALSSSAVLLNGTTQGLHVSTPPLLQVGSATGWSFGAWVRMDTPQTAHIITCRFSDASVDYQLHISSGTFALYGNGLPTLVGGSSVTGVWTFVVATIAAGAANLYVQGASVNTFSSPLPTSAAGTEFCVGSDNGGTRGVAGAMQGAFVFGRGLSAAEITYLYNSGNGRDYSELDSAFKTNLRAWWPLTEASGNRVDVHNSIALTPFAPPLGTSTGPIASATIFNGNPVSKWLDFSSNHLDVTRPVAGGQPFWIASTVNNQPALRFDGIDDLLSRAGVLGSAIAQPDQQTIFVVSKSNGPTSNNTLIAWEPSATEQNYLATWNDANLYYAVGDPAGTVGRVFGPRPTAYDGSWHIVEGFRSNPAASISVDGTTAVSGSYTDVLDTTLTAPLNIGAGVAGAGIHYGDMAEMVIYTRALTSTERNSVRDYLMTKYGIAQSKILDETSVSPTTGGYLLLEDGNNSGLGRLAMEA